MSVNLAPELYHPCELMSSRNVPIVYFVNV